MKPPIKTGLTSGDILSWHESRVKQERKKIEPCNYIGIISAIMAQLAFYKLLSVPGATYSTVAETISNWALEYIELPQDETENEKVKIEKIKTFVNKKL